MHALLAFVIQMDHVAQVRPNTQTHPEFGQALEAAGYEVLREEHRGEWVAFLNRRPEA